MADDKDYMQVSFVGGMNLLQDDTRLAEDEYRLGFDLRARFDTCEPIKKSVVESSPLGIKQGLYAFNDYLLMFSSGRAYYKLSGTDNWHVIGAFHMSETAARFFVCAVPVPTVTQLRKAITSDSTATDVNYVPASNTGLVTSGVEAGLVVQDGVNRPWFIYINPSVNQPAARLIGDYAGWSQINREYVPIGRQMLFFDGILYLVSIDGQRLLRSVTGRPLDFMVAVTSAGEKTSTDESIGGADCVSYSVGVGHIQALAALSTSSIFVATEQDCYAVTPDYNNTLYGEPKFNRQYLFRASCVNENSFVDILGDFAFIDPEGLRSFNAVVQERNEGRNEIFSRTLLRLFKDKLQDRKTACAIIFDNYAIFSMLTIYGNVAVVYDTLLKKFVSLDSLPNGYAIKQFATISTDKIELYGINTNDELVHFYASDEYARAFVRSRAFTAQAPSMQLKTHNFRAVFSEVKSAGTVNVVQYVDNKRESDSLAAGNRTKQFLVAKSGIRYAAYYPVSFDAGVNVNNLLFPFTYGKHGWKVVYTISWSGGAILTAFEIELGDVKPKNPNQSKES